MMDKRDTRFLPAFTDPTGEVAQDETKGLPSGNDSAGHESCTRTDSRDLFDLVAWIDGLHNSFIKGSGLNKQDAVSMDQFKKSPISQTLVDAFIKLTPTQITLLLAIKESAQKDLTQLLPLSLAERMIFGLLPNQSKVLPGHMCLLIQKYMSRSMKFLIKASCQRKLLCVILAFFMQLRPSASPTIRGDLPTGNQEQKSRSFSPRKA